MIQTSGRIVIIGAGHAGGTVAALLRQYGWQGPITLLGDEPIAPYQRPPLSKAWLKGEADADSLALKPLSFYAEAGIELRLATFVTSADAGQKVVALASGEQIGFDHLILATGAAARKLPISGGDLRGVLSLRTAADAETLKAALGPGKTLAVVGGGYVGLEAAASARALGAAVVVIEREQRILARVAGAVLSDFFQSYHAARGVSFICSAGVEAFEGVGDQFAGVRLADGRLIAADAALVGVGASPNIALARQLGCACGQGVIVDLNAMTNVAEVYAIGDCTERPLPLYGLQGRLESVPNALEQAKQAAAHLCARPAPAPEAPWFWSDQYDLKLQIAGLPFHAVRAVMRGAPPENPMDPAKFAIFHLDAENHVQAVEAINAPAEFMMGRQVLSSRQVISPEKLADMSISMKEVAV